ncbi:MAG: NAD-dependent epimerase/dehydratase family protein [Patescibacteria group bacterium]
MENFWNNKKVFITGANGFLGSHLVRELVQHGARPVVLVYEENPGGIFETEGLAAQTTVVRGDVRDLKQMNEIVNSHGIDTIYHLAAQALIDQAIDDPIATFEANIQGTWNILEAAKKSPQVKRIIVASSDKAYGMHENLPYREHVHHLRAGYPYEVSKTCADLIAQSFYKAFHLPVVITRCGNLYGPGDLKLNRLVPHTICQLYHDRPPIIRDTGTSVRDYVYIGDVAEGYRLLAEKMDATFYGEAFNISTGTPLSVAEVIAMISTEMGKDIEPQVISTHGLEIPHQYASYDKAKKTFGWEPKHSFVEGLKKTIQWYVAHFEHEKTKRTIAVQK